MERINESGINVVRGYLACLRSRDEQISYKMERRYERAASPQIKESKRKKEKGAKDTLSKQNKHVEGYEGKKGRNQVYKEPKVRIVGLVERRVDLGVQRPTSLVALLQQHIPHFVLLVFGALGSRSFLQVTEHDGG